jgi:hypothetical protein
MARELKQRQSELIIMNEVKDCGGCVLCAKELERVRQWFNAVQDLNESYLEQEDFILAKKIYEQLAMRVSNSIMDRIST